MLTRPGVREPRENRGRLRHCNGLQVPTATGPKRPGRREQGFQAPSQDIGRIVLVMVSPGRDQLLRQEKDEAGPFRGCGKESLNAFILRFAG